MAGGGAGKVYFVLYLAVILELLIIIVERDEAEEHLIQKQKETMKIVESILSQLQTGPGSEGISTSPKDEITLQEPGSMDASGPKIKQDRTYFIEVGVTDVAGSDKIDPNREDAKQMMREIIRLANVQELEYQIYYHPSQDPDRAPQFPPSDSLDLLSLKEEGQFIGERVENEFWKLQMVRKLRLDINKTEDWREPHYGEYEGEIGSLSSFAPADAMKVDSVYRYSQPATDELASDEGGKIKKRVFVVRFQAPSKPGWYKLRFASKTNRILGLRGEELSADIDPAAKVNIGTVQLKVKELLTVQKELTKRLDGLGIPNPQTLLDVALRGDEEEIRRAAHTFDQRLAAAVDKLHERRANGEFADPNEATRLVSQVELFGYIAKLLTPGLSETFDQNKGSKEIDIRVIKPPVNIADPYVNLDEEVFVFDKLKPAFTFSSGPFQGNNLPTAQIITPSGPVGLSIEPIESSLASASDAGGKGGKRFYRAIANRALQPGKYTITVVQRNASKSKEQSTDLHVYPTKLTDKSKEELLAQMNLLYYGYALTVKAEPSSGGAIPADQFRVYASTDANQQDPPRYGLTDRVFLPAAAKKATLRISWVSPYTKEEVDLFPLVTGNIRQEGPQFDFSRINTRVSGSSQKKFKVEVRDVIVIPPLTDTASITASPEDVQTPTVEVSPSIPNFDLDDAYVEAQGGGRYTIVANFSGDAGREPEVIGSMMINVSTQVKNPKNSVTSDPSSDVISVQVLYEVPRAPRGGPRRR